jgi:hypothetical protein
MLFCCGRFHARLAEQQPGAGPSSLLGQLRGDLPVGLGASEAVDQLGRLLSGAGSGRCYGQA